ncbi:hypothetical protein CMUS01_01433 [Colletotrichum musicola]|uniref:Uncharacterized protein n=1 Tax=Colletotrichum musicola TaxID=2175873 RepID=A0A8H6NX31_9PEZI|nr:hypothetical protein CMUS01_01433 [Colletotrichum musicola]
MLLTYPTTPYTIGISLAVTPEARHHCVEPTHVAREPQHSPPASASEASKALPSFLDAVKATGLGRVADGRGLPLLRSNRWPSTLASPSAFSLLTLQQGLLPDERSNPEHANGIMGLDGSGGALVGAD